MGQRKYDSSSRSTVKPASKHHHEVKNQEMSVSHGLDKLKKAKDLPGMSFWVCQLPLASILFPIKGHRSIISIASLTPEVVHGQCGLSHGKNTSGYCVRKCLDASVQRGGGSGAQGGLRHLLPTVVQISLHKGIKCCWRVGQLVSQGCRQLSGGLPPEGMY